MSLKYSNYEMVRIKESTRSIYFKDCLEVYIEHSNLSDIYVENVKRITFYNCTSIIRVWCTGSIPKISLCLVSGVNVRIHKINKL